MLNKNKNIILTHWAGSDDKKVIVNPTICKYVKNYHLLQLRFIYSRYKNKFKGVVLNCSQDMVCPISVVAFLGTIAKLPNPVLILTSDFNLKYWRYFLSLIPQANLQFSGSNSGLKTKENNLVILLGTSKDLFSEYNHFSMIVIDDADSIFNARTKRGDFNICITYKNFYRNPNDKLLWTILNWSNIYFVGTFVTFSEKFNEFLENRVEPYPSIVLRITWGFCDTFKKINVKELQNEIKNLDTSDSDSDECDLNYDKKRKKPKKGKSISEIAKRSLVPSKHSSKKSKALQNQENIHRNIEFGHFFEESPDISHTLVDNASKSSPKTTERTPERYNSSCVKATPKVQRKICNISYEIEDPKTPESKNTDYADSVNVVDESLPTIKETIKQEVVSSQTSDEDINNSIIGKIFDSPVKLCPEKSNLLDLLDTDSVGFEGSDILSHIFDNYSGKRSHGSSIMEGIIDAKLNRVVENSSFTRDSDDSDGESILSKLFPK